jgi:hypothetical protein
MLCHKDRSSIGVQKQLRISRDFVLFTELHCHSPQQNLYVGTYVVQPCFSHVHACCRIDLDYELWGCASMSRRRHTRFICITYTTICYSFVRSTATTTLRHACMTHPKAKVQCKSNGDTPGVKQHVCNSQSTTPLYVYTTCMRCSVRFSHESYFFSE